MSLHVAFLRGMNVGGHRIANDELSKVFAKLGFADVKTFRASGNVIFDAPDDPIAQVAERIETGLEQELGYAVPVFARDAKQLLAIAAHEPFDPQLVESSRGKLQVAFLGSKPSAADRKRVLALSTEEDRLTIKDTELYWLPSGGLLESELDLKAIDKALGKSTHRTKGTVDLIAAKHFAD